MEVVSVFDIIKIGIGPSSSHTMGPWKAAQLFSDLLDERGLLNSVTRVRVLLFGSLALTGIGHGSNVAVALGLSGEDYTKIEARLIPSYIERIKEEGKIRLKGEREISFFYDKDIVLKRGKSLAQHPNGMRFEATLESGEPQFEEYFSVGGGFVLVGSDKQITRDLVTPRFPCEQASSIESHCRILGCSVSRLVDYNELAWRSELDTREMALQIWSEMVGCILRGVQQSGPLPGGLGVMRRARDLNRTLLKNKTYQTQDEWLQCIQKGDRGFNCINKWITCFALATSEENASFGRVVTSPTNGAAGVVPAVLMYGYCFEGLSEKQIVDFLLVAGEIGMLFKLNATISAAMGGCQAEIGVSSAMAAAGLVESRGGSPEQVLMAAEIAMEHHLGLTCDPIGGLVQVPCIERNSMGAIKAITAANIAMESDPGFAKVRLDDVIKTMWSTAKDMNKKYKETSRGGLAVNIPVSSPEC